MRTSKPITVTLGKQQQSVDARLASGAYDSASEVIRVAFCALDREEQAVNEVLRARIRASIDDPRPSLTADEAEAEMARFMPARAKRRAVRRANAPAAGPCRPAGGLPRHCRGQPERCRGGWLCAADNGALPQNR
ncbi:type II toxin-antitoxin system ParD family antitoxin [Mesorhizobium sp. M0991]|uniref:ribbon-helix-helix domain-containing protein n=1 Tax=Mesorhizobium sp. M0991 TaxID=2957043 RepID=UPI0033364A7E